MDVEQSEQCDFLGDGRGSNDTGAKVDKVMAWYRVLGERSQWSVFGGGPRVVKNGDRLEPKKADHLIHEHRKDK